MTPQERQLIDQLFERLATLEGMPRDPDAVRAINEGLERAPHALYPLVQTVLVQDEALKRADARIRELESELGIEPAQPARQGGFLDNMRDTLFGRRDQQGSVPSVRPGDSRWGNAAPQQTGGAPGAQPWAGQQPQQPAQGGWGGGGGSFLGTAAATVAGVVGGTMLMNSMRGMFGGQQGQGQGAFEPGSQGGTPWGSESGGDLSRQAGIEDIGRGGRTAAYDDGQGAERHGLFDTGQNDAGNDGDFGIGGDFDGGSDTA